MGILPPGSGAGEQNVSPPPLRLGSDSRAASSFLLSKDVTGGLLSTVLFMDSVESWVLSRLEVDPEQAEQVRSRMRRLSEILTQYKESIQPDNNALAQLLTWMKASESFYTLDYLTQAQPDFTVQFIDYCMLHRDDDVSASLALERISVLYRTRLLDRVYSPKNIEFIAEVLMEGMSE